MAQTTPSTCRRAPTPASRLAPSSKQPFPHASFSSQTEASLGQHRKRKSNIAKKGQVAASIWLRQVRASHFLVSGGLLICWRRRSKLAREWVLSSRLSICPCPNPEATLHRRTPSQSRASKAKAPQRKALHSQLALPTQRISKARKSNCRKIKAGRGEPPMRKPKKHLRASKNLSKKLAITENELS